MPGPPPWRRVVKEPCAPRAVGRRIRWHARHPRARRPSTRHERRMDRACATTEGCVIAQTMSFVRYVWARTQGRHATHGGRVRNDSPRARSLTPAPKRRRPPRVTPGGLPHASCAKRDRLGATLLILGPAAIAGARKHRDAEPAAWQRMAARRRCCFEQRAFGLPSGDGQHGRGPRDLRRPEQAGHSSLRRSFSAVKTTMRRKCSLQCGLSCEGFNVREPATFVRAPRRRSPPPGLARRARGRAAAPCCTPDRSRPCRP